MIIKQLDLPIGLLWTKLSDFPIPLVHLSPECKVYIFKQDVFKFLAFIQTALFTNLSIQHLIGDETLPTMKKVSNGAASNPKCLPTCMPHPAGNRLQKWGVGFTFRLLWKVLYTKLPNSLLKF